MNEEAYTAPGNAMRGLVNIDGNEGLSQSSILIVPANEGNDNVTVECVIVTLSGPSVDSSPPAYLSVEGKINFRPTG